MIMYNLYDSEKYPKRKRNRLQGHDYAASNYYFLTICTHEKKCIFGKPNDLNALGKIVRQGILKIPEHHPNVKVDQFAVMPNHVHLLLYLDPGGKKLKDVVGGWKAYVTREARKTDPSVIIWQRSYHDHIIRNENSYQKIWQYIVCNPMNWEKDCFYSEL